MHAYRREKFNHHANYTTERKNDIQATDAWKSGTIDNLESAVLWQPSWSKQKMLNRNINSLKYGLLWQKRPNKTPLQRGLYGGSLSTGLLKFGGTEQQYEMPVVVSMEWGDTHKIFAAKSMQCHPTSTSRNSAKKQVSIFMPAARILICWIMMPCFWYSHERYQDWKKSHLIPPFECVIH